MMPLKNAGARLSLLSNVVASCDVYSWAVGEGIDELDGLGGCGDYGAWPASEAEGKVEVVPCLCGVLPRCELVAPSGVELWAS